MTWLAYRKALGARMGRRGEFLLYAAVCTVLIGYGYIADPLVRHPGVRVVHDLIPPPWWGVGWILCGLVGIVFAWTRKPGRDRIGYAALMLMPSLQAASYAVSWVLHLMGQPGDPRGIFTSLLFIAFARFVGLVAGWPEPRRRLPQLPAPPRRP